MCEDLDKDDIIYGMGHDFFHSVITGDEPNAHHIIHTVSESDSPVFTHNFLMTIGDCIEQFCEFLVVERASNGDAIKKLCDRIKRYKLDDGSNIE